MGRGPDQGRRRGTAPGRRWVLATPRVGARHDPFPRGQCGPGQETGPASAGRSPVGSRDPDGTNAAWGHPVRPPAGCPLTPRGPPAGRPPTPRSIHTRNGGLRVPAWRGPSGGTREAPWGRDGVLGQSEGSVPAHHCGAVRCERRARAWGPRELCPPREPCIHSCSRTRGIYSGRVLPTPGVPLHWILGSKGGRASRGSPGVPPSPTQIGRAHV